METAPSPAVVAAPRRLPLAAVLGAYLTSVTCTAVSAIAIPWLVLSTTGSATRTGVAVFAEMAPYVTDQAGVRPALLSVGVVVFLLTLGPFVVPAFRLMNDPPPAAGATS